ncbi:cyclin-L1-like [Limulus polyphemus]|uniref:Cyclin-L1-like n=1 Tax=Limulus polyphemus TaxID=6850 RepID=A0ABM1BGZ7_LIMPO|nr:cyclin-L1-like [Limulus polyphemus]
MAVVNASCNRVSVTNGSEPVKSKKQDYGRVILTLQNCIIPPCKLYPTPSMIDGVDRETEKDLRILGCDLIQTSGYLLRLPQVAMATGQVLFQRFFFSKSFVKHGMEILAMACITLASKIEEAPRRIRDVVNVLHHIKQLRAGKTIQPLILDQNYINLKNQVIKAERRVLKELGFCVHVKHPHKIIVTFLQVLECEKNHKLMQTAWNYMNDSLRSEVFVQYHPESIACACIYLSARLLQIPLPSKPAWYLMFGVTEEVIEDICHTVLALYTRRKSDPHHLDKTIEELKKAQQESKLKAKELSGNNTPIPNNAGFSPGPKNNSPNLAESPLVNSKDTRGNEVFSKLVKENQLKRKGSPHSSPNRYTVKNKSSSGSPSPKRREKTPPRSYKNRDRSHSCSKSPSRSKYHSFNKGKILHSRSRSPSRSPRKYTKKSYKVKSRRKSRSQSFDHYNHFSSSHKVRKEKSKRY